MDDATLRVLMEELRAELKTLKKWFPKNIVNCGTYMMKNHIPHIQEENTNIKKSASKKETIALMRIIHHYELHTHDDITDWIKAQDLRFIKEKEKEKLVKMVTSHPGSTVKGRVGSTKNAVRLMMASDNMPQETFNEDDLIRAQLFDHNLLSSKQECFYCRNTFEKMDKDHLHPMQPSKTGYLGRNTLLNIVYACKGCNRQKGKQMPFDYIENKHSNVPYWTPNKIEEGRKWFNENIDKLRSPSTERVKLLDLLCCGFHNLLHSTIESFIKNKQESTVEELLILFHDRFKESTLTTHHKSNKNATATNAE